MDVYLDKYACVCQYWGIWMPVWMNMHEGIDMQLNKHVCVMNMHVCVHKQVNIHGWMYIWMGMNAFV